DFLLNNNPAAVNQSQEGTKAGALFVADVQSEQQAQFRLRLSATPNPGPFADFDRVLNARRQETDEFYSRLQKEQTDADACLVQRQAFAGMIWSKQRYAYNVRLWLQGDQRYPPPAERAAGRNCNWLHFDG